MNFQRLTTIEKQTIEEQTRRYPCCCKASRTMSSMVCWRVLTSVSKDASNWVTGREVSAMMLLSAVRRTVRRFSQFYTQTQTRERVTIAICQIIIRFVPVCKIHVMVTCKNNTICKCTWHMCRRSSLNADWFRWRLHLLQYGRSRQRLQRPFVVLETPQLVHEAPMRYNTWWSVNIRITTHNHVRSRDDAHVELLKLNKNIYVIKTKII